MPLHPFDPAPQRLNRRHALWSVAACLLSAVPARAAPPPTLTCSMELLPRGKGGSARPLRVTLVNQGKLPVQVLEWATPFEGWLWPFVQLRRDGQDMPYLAATAKRGEPMVQEYLRFDPGQQRQATVDLADAFDLTQVGRYEVTPRLQLRDVVVVPEAAPRKRAAFQPLQLDCPGVGFTVAPR